MGRVSYLSPNLRTPNPGFNPGFTPFYITNARDEPRVKPGVWRPEMWALEDALKNTSGGYSEASGGILHHRSEVLVIIRQLQAAEVRSKLSIKIYKSSFVLVPLVIT
jgi:hypothetical protein